MRAVFFLAMLTMSSSASRGDATDEVPEREGEADKRWSIDGETESVVRVRNQCETRNLSQEVDERGANDEDAAKDDLKVKKRRMSIPVHGDAYPCPRIYSKYSCHRGYSYGCKGLILKECWKTDKRGSGWYEFTNYCKTDWDCLRLWEALEDKKEFDEPCDRHILDKYPCRYGHRYGCSAHRCWITRKQTGSSIKWYRKDNKRCNNHFECDPAELTRTEPFIHECGTRPGRIRRRRIVGGNSTVRGEIPWQVTVMSEDRERTGPVTTTFICGGTIIDRKWILTARHCVDYLNKFATVTVLAGKVDRLRKEEGQQEWTVERIFPYPWPVDAPFHQKIDDLIRRNNPGIEIQSRRDHWEFQALLPDLALLRLEKELRFDNYTQPACLPSPANEVADYALGNRVIVSGWGDTSGNRSSPRFLQVVELPISSHPYCSHAEVAPLKFCAANSVVGGVSTCHGDSGGPAVKKVGGRFTVLGVVSFGSEGSMDCSARPQQTSLFVKVSHYVDWIKQTVRDHNDNLDYLSHYHTLRSLGQH